MSDLIDQALGDAPQEPEAVQEQVEAPQAVEAPAEAVSETPQEEEPQVSETPPEEEPKEEQPKEEHTVPLAVFQSMRSDLKAQIDAAMAKQPEPKPEPVKAPDMFEDPEGFQKYMGEQMQKTRASVVADVSEAMAVEAYGKEVVDEAFAAVRASGDGARFLSSQHPFGDMVKWHKQQKVLQEIGDDPDAYRQKVETEVRQKIEAEIAAKQAKAMAEQAPPSMAKTNGSGGTNEPGWTGPTPLDNLL